MLRVRLSEKQERRVRYAAFAAEKDMSEVVRDLISSLPAPPDGWSPLAKGDE